MTFLNFLHFCDGNRAFLIEPAEGYEIFSRRNVHCMGDISLNVRDLDVNNKGMGLSYSPFPARWYYNAIGMTLRAPGVLWAF